MAETRIEVDKLAGDLVKSLEVACQEDLEKGHQEEHFVN